MSAINVARTSQDSRIDKVKVVSVDEVPGSGGNKVRVTMELPLEEDQRGEYSNDIEQFFRTDDVKRLAIREASKVTFRSTGWSDISRVFYFKEGDPISHHGAADAARVIYTCQASL